MLMLAMRRGALLGARRSCSGGAPPSMSASGRRCRPAPAAQAAGSSTRSANGSRSSSSIYDDPALYDDAFSYRDFGAEAQFLADAWGQHGDGGELRHTLETGCGPARHSILLAQRLAEAGGSATGLDSNATMLAYARERAQAAGAVNLDLVEGDMRSFALPCAGSVDLAMCLLGSFSHMLDNAAAADAMGCMWRHVRPGGLLVLELAHPGDLFDGSLMLGDGSAEMWEVERRRSKAGGGGGKAGKLMVEWGTDQDEFDPATQVLYRHVAIHEQAGDQIGEQLHAEVVTYRQYTLQEVELLGLLTGFKVAGVYGDLRLDVDDLRHEDAFRMVVVMQRQPSQPLWRP